MNNLVTADVIVPSFTHRQKVGLVVGPLLFLAMLLVPLPAGMEPEAQKVAAVAMLMASFWVAETIPIPVTAMLPIFMFPLLGVMPTGQVTLSYGNEINFLFMGGFVIAVAMQRWRLHRRIALKVIDLVGSSPSRLVMGFMLATGLLSMWISNTATAMMMMPVALAVIEQTRAEHGVAEEGPPGSYGFGVALMLCIAYSASIGGVATLVGTPPNAILAGIIDSVYGYRINFFDWMKLGVPIAVCMGVLTYFLLTRVLFRLEGRGRDSVGARRHIRAELDRMGPISAEETRVAMVFGFVAAAWILRGLLNPAALSMVSDAAIAMAGAFVLFTIPAGRDKSGFLLDWRTAATIPWDIIILMGGGFALASGFSESGLTGWLADQLRVLQGVHFFVIVLAVVLCVTFLTELTSNSATATLFVPVMGALAVSMDLHPFTLMVPAALAASLAFMLPVATPPNAIMFGSRQFTIGQMARAGIWLNLLGAVLVSVLGYWLLPVLQ